MLEQCRKIGEAKRIRIIAQAVATAERGKDIALDAGEIVLFAYARIGELTREMSKARAGGAGGGTKVHGADSRQIALASEGLSKQEAQRCERVAALKDSGMLARLVSAERGAKRAPSVRAAVDLARLDPARQHEALAKLGDVPHVKQAAREVRRDRAMSEAGKSARLMGKFRVFYADPPWQYGDAGYGSGPAEFHYPTMSLSELCALPVVDLALADAVLFIWATSPLLEDSFKVIGAWGFHYKASFVWDKIKHNVGHYNSVRHELLLIATRGSCTPDDRRLDDSVVSIERGAHSVKPERFREIIDRMYPHGSRIELFARRAVVGWDVWGNQARVKK
jgi:N6-adenosine-specific RNA methylase IME4